MAVGAKKCCDGYHVSDDTPWVDLLRGGRRSAEGHGKPLDAGSAGPFVVEILGGGLRSEMGVACLIMNMKNLCIGCLLCILFRSCFTFSFI
jgi:hypothetical protein